MPDFWIFLSEMFDASAVGYMTVIIMAALAAVMIKEMTNSTGLTILFTVANVFGAFAGMYYWKYSGVPLVYGKEPNMVVGAGAGMLVSFALILGIIRIVYRVLESKKALVRTDITQHE